MKRKHVHAHLLCIALLSSLCVFAQIPAPKELPAKRTTQKVKIDGLPDEPAWKDAALMTDLIEFRPKMGAKEEYANRSETWLMYDDEGIYFGGYLHERTKDSIAMELTGTRDGFGTNDYIGLILDTYHDKLNGFEYFVTPLNEQWDSKMSENNSNGESEDFTWNAVWKSGAVIHKDGWSFEMFIPYSAIRFGKKDVQNWGLNITRRRRKSEQQYTWNPINTTVSGFLTQEGIWTGITNIKPPVRLQFSPYFSVYANHFPVNKPDIKNLTSQVNGGLDVKYGINQAFTLDMTLIPDFGQVQSDNRVLNLTPFEVKYTENRPFFTEGTELFSKGNLFYTRRIGIDPILLHWAGENAGANEYAKKTPVESKLINATKVSGRTSKGLGIAMLNAVTNNRYATLEDSVTKGQRKSLIDPLTNYNVFVLDQTLKNNSSVSLVNTSVWRSGADYDANVTAALFTFADKKNMWYVSGQLNNSNLLGYNQGKTLSGYSHSFVTGKRSGRFQFNLWQDLTDTKYTSNDLGYFTNNNFFDHGVYAGYRWIEPKGWYNRININFNANISKLFKPIGTIEHTYQRSNVNVNFSVQMKKLHWFGSFWNYTPHQNDFYEPRRTGWFFYRGASVMGGVWFESNSSKKYFGYIEMIMRKYTNFYGQSAMDIFYDHRYRFGNKFSLSHSISYQPRNNNMGYTTYINPGIIFARRDVNTVENIVNAKYSFSNKMGITFRVRHYNSSVDNKEFFTLQQNGKLASNTTLSDTLNRNVNYFNIDMVYTWQFAPGSFLNIVWKDAGFTQHTIVEKGYFRNFSNTVESDQNNNISLKIIYFLDYLDLTKSRKKSSAQL